MNIVDMNLQGVDEGNGFILMNQTVCKAHNTLIHRHTLQTVSIFQRPPFGAPNS
jgi:hypothetical protein